MAREKVTLQVCGLSSEHPTHVVGGGLPVHEAGLGVGRYILPRGAHSISLHVWGTSKLIEWA